MKHRTRWNSDPLYDEGDMPPHLDETLPRIPYTDFQKMNKQQKKWWIDQKQLYRDDLLDEKRHARLKRKGY